MANRETKLNIVIDAQNKATSGLRSASKELDTMSRRTDALAGTFSVLKAATAAAAAAIGFAGLNVIKAGAQFEQTQIAFETMLGSAEQAKKTLGELSTFAAATPFELGQLEEASKRLLAYGTSADELIPTLKMLGDITAGVGMDKLPQLILAFGQVQAATKLTGAELRQFSEAGVPLLGVLADQFNTTEAAIIEMVSDGAIGFEDMKKALASLSGEGGKFQDLMQKQSTSLGGMWSNLKDQISLTARALGTELLPYAKPVLQELIDLSTRFREALSEGQVVDSLSNLRTQLVTIFTTLEEKTGIVSFLAEQWKRISDAITIELMPALAKLWEALQPYIPGLTTLGKIIGWVFIEQLKFAIDKITDFIVGISQLITMAAKMGAFIYDTFAPAWAWIAEKINAAIEPIKEFYNWLKKAFDMMSNLPGKVGSFLSGARAEGGPVSGGSQYMVGEKGPEMFVPKTSGTIIPNNRLWQGGSTIVNITGNTLLSDDVAEQMGDMIMNRLKISNAL